MARPGAALLIALLVSASGGAGPAGAVIPSATKLAEASAEANRLAGRSEPLWFEVSLRLGDDEAVAEGVLASHPTGLARLELRSHRGFVERHLLQGNAYTASRNGQRIEDPRPFLPPLFLLQATSGDALRAALESFGIAASTVVLGRVGEHDCYVFGGRLPPTPGEEEHRLPSLWVDLESYEVIRIDGRDGVRFHFGPKTAFDEGIWAPRWIEIETPGQPPARLDVIRVAPANAPAAAFGTDWLSDSPEPPLEPGADPGNRSPAAAAGRRGIFPSRGNSGLMQPDRNTE